MTNHYKLLAASAAQPGSALGTEREERKHIPENSAAARNQAAAFEKTLHSSVEEQIRSRAYELYLQRGRQDGKAEQDWLDAELELLAGR